MISSARAANPWLAQPAMLDAVTPEVPGVTTYHLRFVDADLNRNYRYQPGQFNMIYLPGVGEVPISLSGSSPSRGSWDHTIRIAGNTTRTLSQLECGKTVGVRGPYGTAWPLDACHGKDVILVAGGIGLAPLRSAVWHFLENRAVYGKLTLLYGARTPDTLLYEKEYADWGQRGFAIHTTVDRYAPGWMGNVGVVSLLLDRLAFEPADTVMLTCGPEVMMRYAARSALARGMSREQIWLSLERNMQCAVGLCGHCQLGPEFICKTGPVFRQDRIEPFLQVKAL